MLAEVGGPWVLTLAVGPVVAEHKTPYTAQEAGHRAAPSTLRSSEPRQLAAQAGQETSRV